jgi:hypothetical protein
MSTTTIRVTFCKAAIFSAAFLLVASTTLADVVFRDTFNRPNNFTIGTNSGPEGSATWTKSITPVVVPTGSPGTVAVNTNQILVAHGNDDSIYQLSVPTSGFASPWPASKKLADSPGVIKWYINMHSGRTGLGGIGAGSNGMGFALAATNTSFGAVGNNGYLLTWGNTGTPDPLQLIAFTGNGGINPPTVTPIVLGTAAGAPFSDMNTNYFSFRVEFDPGTSIWSLYGRDDGASSFADPEVNTGYTLIGSNTNSTHTSAVMNNTGLVGSYTTSGATNLYHYDNVVIEVVPEPSTIVFAGLGLVGLVGFARRRSAKSKI